jgi:hypothetical protein
MAGTFEIIHRGKKIFCLSVAGLQLHDKKELKKHLQSAKDEIRKHPPKSLLVITDVTSTGYDTEVANLFKEYANHNTPYVKASAVVGVSGIQKVILTAIKALTNREFYLTSTVDEAKEWLVNQ